MRKGILILVPLFLLGLLGAVVMAQRPDQSGPPAGCQRRLEQYISFAFPGQAVTIQRVERAGMPEALARDSAYAVFGDSTYYATDLSPDGQRGDGTMPLPFPPKELWCVLLQHQDGQPGGVTSTIVLAGLHMDMYNADWVIHVGPRDLSTPGVVASLRRVGCDLALDRSGPLQ